MRETDELTALYLCERERLTRQISRSVGGTAPASDIVQDVFLRLWERAAEWGTNPTAFLRRCVRNAAIDHIRSEKVRTAFFEGIAAEQYAAAEVSPLTILMAKQAVSRIDQALMALPKRTRHIFLLNRVHGRSFVEIASVLGISERAVAKQIARAVAVCREACKDAVR